MGIPKAEPMLMSESHNERILVTRAKQGCCVPGTKRGNRHERACVTVVSVMKQMKTRPCHGHIGQSAPPSLSPAVGRAGHLPIFLVPAATSEEQA